MICLTCGAFGQKNNGAPCIECGKSIYGDVNEK